MPMLFFAETPSAKPNNKLAASRPPGYESLLSKPTGQRIPIDADIIEIYATAPNNRAFRDSKEGKSLNYLTYLYLTKRTNLLRDTFNKTA